MDKTETYELLNRLGIQYTAFEHDPVYTIEEMDALPIPDKDKVAKNLFLRDDRKLNYYLVTMPGHKRADLKTLSARIPSRKLTFAKEEELKGLLLLKRGAVTPLGVLNNKERNVTLVFDKELSNQVIGVHPMENTATVFLSAQVIMKLAEEHGSPVVRCDMDE